MTIARVGAGSSVVEVNGGTSIPISYTPNAAGNLLTVSTGVVSNSTPTVADSGSTSWSVRSVSVNPSGLENEVAQVGYRENIPSGLTGVTVSIATTTYGWAKVEEWSGAATSSVYDATSGDVTANGGTNGTSLASGSLTPSDAADLILGICTNDDTAGSPVWNTPGGGFSESFHGDPYSNNSGAQAVYKLPASTSAQSLTWSTTASCNRGFTSLLVAFKPAAGGGGGLTLTESVTEANDRLSSSILATIALTLAATEARDTLAAQSALAVALNVAATESSDTETSSATTSIQLSASLVERNDAGSAASAIAIALAALFTESNDSPSSNVVQAGGITAAIIEAGDVGGAAGALAISLAAALNESSDVGPSAASVATALAAAIAETADVSSSTAAGPGVVTLTLSVTEATDAIGAAAQALILIASSAAEAGDSDVSGVSQPVFLVSITVEAGDTGSASFTPPPEAPLERTFILSRPGEQKFILSRVSGREFRMIPIEGEREWLLK